MISQGKGQVKCTIPGIHVCACAHVPESVVGARGVEWQKSRERVEHSAWWNKIFFKTAAFGREHIPAHRNNSLAQQCVKNVREDICKLL